MMVSRPKCLRTLVVSFLAFSVASLYGQQAPAAPPQQNAPNPFENVPQAPQPQAPKPEAPKPDAPKPQLPGQPSPAAVAQPGLAAPPQVGQRIGSGSSTTTVPPRAASAAFR